MIISNIIYNIVAAVIAINVLALLATEKDDIKHRIMCPAVILAARRKPRVSGRTVVLMNSIIIRNGFSHSGALSGSICLMVFFGENSILLVTSIIHVGALSEIVRMMWLVMLNMYGSIPIIFM